MVRSAAIVGLVFAAAALHAADDPKSLDGAYAATAVIKDGVPISPDVVSKTTVKLAGDELTITIAGKAFPAKLKFDAKATPATIDLAPSDGPDKGRTFPGIYKQDKDELTILFAEKGDRPKEFKSTDNTTLIRCKRVEK